MENQNEVELPFKSEQFKEAWNEWMEWRKEKRFPKYVPKGLKKTFSMLQRISGNDENIAIKIIDQSIEQNYQGLFPLKINYGNSDSKNKLGTSAARIRGLENL